MVSDPRLILIVHDNLDQLSELATLLAAEGFATESLTAGELGDVEASVARIEHLHPAAVLYDLGSPHRASWRHLTQIRSHATIRLVPFIVTTASTSWDDFDVAPCDVICVQAQPAARRLLVDSLTAVMRTN